MNIVPPSRKRPVAFHRCAQIAELLKKNGAMYIQDINAAIGIRCDSTLARMEKMGYIEASQAANPFFRGGKGSPHYIKTYSFVKDVSAVTASSPTQARIKGAIVLLQSLGYTIFEPNAVDPAP